MDLSVYYKGARRKYRGKDYKLHRIDVSSVEHPDEAISMVTDALKDEGVRLRTPVLAVISGGGSRC